MTADNGVGCWMPDPENPYERVFVKDGHVIASQPQLATETLDNATHATHAPLHDYTDL